MSQRLEVSPEALHNAGERVLQAVTTSASAHCQHHTNLESAVTGLPMEAAGAMPVLVAAWTTQRAVMHTSVGGQGANTQQAAGLYVQSDERASEALSREMGI